MRNLNIRVRLILTKGNQILLMHDSSVGFYYYPGGHLEFGETVLQAAERECMEECNDKFIFNKILYIRDYLNTAKNEQALELYLLGKLKNGIADNSKDTAGRKTQSLHWFEVDDLPENLYPASLSARIAKDFKNNFSCQGEYLGVIK